ncbi:MAG: tetratricopeptide repeat protein [Proteobacteria bacterium]|nr:tetratricopeptide repeat protein [Pseudomonadota bacterium]
MTDDNGFEFQLDPEQIEDSLREIGERARRLVEDHRYSKVRLTRKGKPLLPDIPLGAFVAGEAASFWLAGPLRLLLVNLGLGTLIKVELVNESDEKVAEGQQAFMDGEVEEAEALYRDALRMKPSNPAAMFALAVVLRITGRLDEARALLLEAAAAEGHPDAEKASALLDKIGRGQPQITD